MTRRLLLLFALVFSLPAYAAASTPARTQRAPGTPAQPTVFLVRHAERADTVPGAAPPMAAAGAPAADPDLSEPGRARAAALAEALKDANITAIYATELKRTQQTAAPLARALGLTVIVVPASGVASLVAKVKALKGNALVVGHSNTVPDIVKALGAKTPVEIGDTEYDNLFIVVRASQPALLRLHYR